MANVYVYGIATAADIFANHQMHSPHSFFYKFYSFTLIS